MGGLVNPSDYFARVADGDGAGGSIVCHDRAGTNGAVVANGHSGQDRHVTANPDVIAYGYGFRPLLAGVALLRISAMTCAVDLHVWTQKTIIANR